MSRHAYVGEGIDEKALVRYAQERDEPTMIHRHPANLYCSTWSKDGSVGCYLVEGRGRVRSDRAR